MIRVGIVALSFLLVSTPAFAYLDPATGSMLIQGLFAVIAAASATIAYYWRVVLKFFSSRKAEDPSSTAKTSKSK